MGYRNIKYTPLWLIDIITFSFNQYWEDVIEAKLLEKGFPALIKGRGKDVRKKYVACLKKYKEVEDWNCQSGNNIIGLG